METAVGIQLGQVARDLDLPVDSVERTVALLDEGNTVPFITRYRKDQTGGLDEEQIRQIQQHVTRLRLLAERKATILKSIEAQGKLTPRLAARIKAAQSAKRLEDLYLPYKPKKQTLATLARQRGLEPLANEILEGSTSAEELAERATAFVRVDRQLHSLEDVMQGVGHLLAERFSERAELRGRLRKILWRTGKLVSSAVAEKKAGESQPADTPKPGSQPQAKVEPQTVAAQDAEPAADGQPQSETATTEGAQPAEQHKGDRSLPAAPFEAGAGKDQPAAPAGGSAGESTQTGGVASQAADRPVEQPQQPAKTARQRAKEKKKQRQVAAFKDYFDYREAISSIPPHRILAINRGERAKILRVKIEADNQAIQQTAEKLLIPADHPHRPFLVSCLRDALARLVLPALEREIRRELTERAERHAVEVFARNLRKLLLQPPVRNRRVLAIDPGLRNGCKLAALDQFGNVLDHGVIHVIGGEQQRADGRRRMVEMIQQHELSVIAIGNGTGCRETERLVADVIAGELRDSYVEYVMVNEAGASVYSTSPVGREELPQFDATIRGAISIGRRLLDPLSELVKINAANIGVGLYQHDVKASHLRESLDEVVASCVNYVGVDVNTASPALLRYVSGLNQLTARRLYEYRLEHGPFKNREQLKDVPGFGEATFVQSAGFLKITGGDNPLDATWIHPESYEVATRVLEKLGSSVNQLLPNGEAGGVASRDLAQRVAQVDVGRMAEELGIGQLLLQDILATILRPGRDPREDLPPPVFRREIMKLEDLKAGMELTGTVLNVVDFGAFVDIGLTDTGLIHISQLADRFVGDPHDIVSVGDVLKVWVLEVDRQRRRVSLTAIEPGTERSPASRSRRQDRRPARQRQGGKRAQAAQAGGAGRGKRRQTRRAKRPARPVTPITQAMVEGKEPMRSFSDLKQFFEMRKEKSDEEAADS